MNLLLKVSILFTTGLISCASFATNIPTNFDDINNEFDKLKNTPTSYGQVARKALKGTCYYSTNKQKPFTIYLAGIILGKDPNKAEYENRVGVYYNLNSIYNPTKGEVYDIILSWWGHLSNITNPNSLMINNANSPDQIELRGLSLPILAQSKLKQDMPCNVVDPDLVPLCKSGFIPKGTQYKSCVLTEELK